MGSSCADRPTDSLSEQRAQAGTGSVPWHPYTNYDRQTRQADAPDMQCGTVFTAQIELPSASQVRA